MKKVKWGVIGAGGIADRRTIPGMMIAKNAELVAVMDIFEDAANRVAQKYGAKKVYLKDKDLIKDPDIDAIYIASPVNKHGKQVVMAEMQGPGVLWRIWSALAESGHVKICLDGQKEPAVDMPFEHYFDGKHAPFNYPSLSYTLEDLGCRGRNLYFPIPYQKSCKVVADEGWGRYYQFTYTSLPKGTKVPTFTADLSPEATAAYGPNPPSS